MSGSNRKTIVELAREANIETDDALIKLWEYGFDQITSPVDLLSGAQLNRARKCLGIVTKKQLTSVEHWKNYLDLSESEFAELMDKCGIHLSVNAKTLPKGALKRLRAYARATSLDIKAAGHLAFQEESPAYEPTKKKPRFTWRNVGKVREIHCLTQEEVLSIHFALCKDFLNHSDPIEPQGPRDNNLLASAIFRQHTSASDQKKYPTVEMTAAALVHSLVLNHPFHNGNKRTALVSMLVLLDENGMILTTDEDGLFRFILEVAQHKITEMPLDSKGNEPDADAEVIAIAEWIRANSRNIEHGERPLSFRKLRQILSHYGCEFNHSANGCNVKISREIKHGFLRLKKGKILSSNVAYGNEGRDLSRVTINMVRQELELDEQHGIDSAAFYDDVPGIIDGFIMKYRKILLRLSKL